MHFHLLPVIIFSLLFVNDVRGKQDSGKVILYLWATTISAKSYKLLAAKCESGSFCQAMFLLILLVSGALKRCYRCRSRGGLGDCKDPFFGVTTPVRSQTANPLQIPGNAANLQTNVGVDAIPCSSGWCVKYIEGSGNFHSDGTSFLFLRTVAFLWRRKRNLIIHFLFIRSQYGHWTWMPSETANG